MCNEKRSHIRQDINARRHPGSPLSPNLCNHSTIQRTPFLSLREKNGAYPHQPPFLIAATFVPEIVVP